MHNIIKQSVEISQRAQRNYDLTKTIPLDDLDTIIYAAANSPSKQNETHYSLHVYTDQTKIREIYNETKYFSLIKDKTDIESLFEEKDGVFLQNQDLSVRNSQILANALFVFAEDHGDPRGGNSIIAQSTKDQTTESVQNYQEQINFSIGIAVGELILSATMLGYKTGICSAFPKSNVKNIINSQFLPKLLVGVGYEDQSVDRRLHAETLNKDVPEKFRTGSSEERWRFPSLNKQTKVYINGIIT